MKSSGRCRSKVLWKQISNLVYRGVLKARLITLMHHLGFIRGVSWSAQNAESHWSHVHIILMVENISFHAFYKRCGLQRDLKSFSSCLTLQSRLISFLHVSALCKSYNSFQCYCTSCLMPALPLPKSPLISSYQVVGASFQSTLLGPCIHTPSSLQCNFCVPDRLLTVVLWLFYVMQLA